MKRVLGLACVLLLVAFGLVDGCGGGGGDNNSNNGGGGGSVGTATASVNVTTDATAPTGFAFASPVTVKSGTSVTWSNQSSAPHSIVWDAQTPNTSPAPGAGIGRFGAGAKSAAWMAPTVTTSTAYAYHCGIHGPTMAGSITVTP